MGLLWAHLHLFFANFISTLPFSQLFFKEPQVDIWDFLVWVDSGDMPSIYPDWLSSTYTKTLFASFSLTLFRLKLVSCLLIDELLIIDSYHSMMRDHYLHSLILKTLGGLKDTHLQVFAYSFHHNFSLVLFIKQRTNQFRDAYPL